VAGMGECEGWSQGEGSKDSTFDFIRVTGVRKDAVSGKRRGVSIGWKMTVKRRGIVG